MTRLTFPRRYRQQPAGPVALRPELATQVINFYSTAVIRGPAAITNTASQVYHPAGAALRVTGISSYISATTRATAAAWTHLVHFRLRNATASKAICTVADGAGSGTRDRSLLLNASANFTAQIYTGVSVTVSDPTVAVAGKDYVVAVVATGAALQLWVNGVMVANTAAGNSGYAAYGGPTFVAGYGDGLNAADSSSEADIYYVGHFAGAVSPALLTEIGGNPRAAYIQAPRRLWMGGVAAAGPDLAAARRRLMGAMWFFQHNTYSSPDPYYSSVGFLLHFDGTNGSTTITDQKGHTVVVGGASLVTSNKKFGTAALTNSSIKITYASDLLVGTSDYTMEAWYYPDTFSNADNRYLFGQTDFAGGWWLQESVSDQSILVLNYNNSAVITTATGVWAAGQWQHVAVSRVGSTTRLFVNGALVGSTTTAYTLPSSSDYYFNGIPNGVVGLGDDWRLTIGVGRYTTTFTAPTMAFPDS